MTYDPAQDTLDERRALLCMRACDGLATPDELEELAALGEDVASWLGLGEQVLDALRDDSGAPDLVGAIMARLEPEPDPEDLRLGAFSDGQLDAAARAEVSARLGRDPAARAELASLAAVSAALSEAVRIEAGEAPPMWSRVAASLGLEPEAVPGWQPALLREAVLAEAGQASVVDAVMAAVAPVARPTASVPTPTVSAWRRLLDRFALPALGLAAAAALLLSFPAAPPTGALPGVAVFHVSAVNHVDIEDISSGQDAMVQVLKFEDDAPTIIFIDEVPAENEGATL